MLCVVLTRLSDCVWCYQGVRGAHYAVRVVLTALRGSSCVWWWSPCRVVCGAHNGGCGGEAVVRLLTMPCVVVEPL